MFTPLTRGLPSAGTFNRLNYLLNVRVALRYQIFDHVEMPIFGGDHERCGTVHLLRNQLLHFVLRASLEEDLKEATTA